MTGDAHTHLAISERVARSPAINVRVSSAE